MPISTEQKLRFEQMSPRVSNQSLVRLFGAPPPPALPQSLSLVVVKHYFQVLYFHETCSKSVCFRALLWGIQKGRRYGRSCCRWYISQAKHAGVGETGLLILWAWNL